MNTHAGSVGPDITVIEDDAHAFDITWPWHRGELTAGLTAVFRVKDEARNLPWVLPPILSATDRVVLVDNQSADGTPEVAQRVAAEHGAAERLQVLDYPFDVSRCGPEHLGTARNSVHSLTHFYNWSISHVTTRYSMKWDGDMVLTKDGQAMLADLSWQLDGSGAIVLIPRHPLNIESDRVAYLDLGMPFREPWIYPMGPDYTFLKAFEWELRNFPEEGTERLHLPPGLCIELKWLDSDEFAHWTDPSAFTQSRTPRKLREWEVFTAAQQGRGGEVPGVVRIEAPEGVHVVDYVADTWLPQAPRPLYRKPR